MIFVLLVVLIALQAGDAATTLRVLRLGGRELNPLLRRAFERWGARRVVAAVKGAVVAALLLLGAALPAWLLALLVAFYIAVLAHNLKTIKTLEKTR